MAFREVDNTTEVPELSRADFEAARIIAANLNNRKGSRNAAVSGANLVTYVSELIVLTGNTPPTTEQLITGRSQFYIQSGTPPIVYISVEGAAWVNFSSVEVSYAATRDATTWFSEYDPDRDDYMRFRIGGVDLVPIYIADVEAQLRHLTDEDTALLDRIRTERARIDALENRPSGGRPAATEVTVVGDIPADPGVSDTILFKASLSEGLPTTLLDRDGATRLTSVSAGDQFKWFGSAWIKIGDGHAEVGGGITADVARGIADAKIQADVEAWAQRVNANTLIPDTKFRHRYSLEVENGQTFQYITDRVLNASNREFRTHEAQAKQYLEISGLDSDNERIYQALRQGSRVGFFDGRTEDAYMDIVGYHPTHGLEIQVSLQINRLTSNDRYGIKFAPVLAAPRALSGSQIATLLTGQGWVAFTNKLRSYVEGIPDMLGQIRELYSKTLELKVHTSITWREAIDTVGDTYEGAFVIRQDNEVVSSEISAIPDSAWNSTQTVPDIQPGQQARIIYRRKRGTDPADFALLVNPGFGNRPYHGRTPADVDVTRHLIGSTYTYEVQDFSILPNTPYATGKTIILQYHGETTNTEYDGDVSNATFSASLDGNLNANVDTIRKLAEAIDNLNISGGGGVTKIAFPTVAVPSTADEVECGIEGQGSAASISDMPALVGTKYWLDYRELSGKTISISHGTGNFNIHLADLGSINSINARDAVNGTAFWITNRKSAGNITFERSGHIVSIRPSDSEGGAQIAPGYTALVLFGPTPGDSTRFDMSVAAFIRNPSGAGGFTNRFGTTAPANSLGSVGDVYWRSTGEIYVKTGSSTWTLERDLATQAELNRVAERSVQRWTKALGRTLTITGNGTTTQAMTFTSPSQLGLNNPPSAVLSGRQNGGTLSFLFEVRLSPTSNTGGRVRVEVYQGREVFLDKTYTVAVNNESVEVSVPITDPDDTYTFRFTSTGFNAATVVSISNLQMFLQESARSDSILPVQELPTSPGLGDFVRLMNNYTIGGKTYTPGLYHCFTQGTWEKANILKDGDDEGIVDHDTPNSGKLLPPVPKEGQEFFLEADIHAPSGDQHLPFRPTTDPRRIYYGMSKVAGLNLNIDVTGYEYSISTLGTASWTGFIVVGETKVFAIDDRSNYLRGFDFSFIRRSLTRNSSYDVNLGTGTWMDVDENTDYIVLARTSSNALVVYDLHTRRLVSGGVRLVSFAPAGVAMFLDEMYAIDNSSNTARFYTVEDNSTFTADASKNISLGTGTWQRAFTRSSEDGYGYYLYVQEGGMNWHCWKIVGNSRTRHSVRDFALASDKSWRGTFASAGKMLFLNDTDDQLDVYDDQRIALPPVYDSGTIAAVYMPYATGQARRGQWHVIYDRTFPPLQSGRRPVPTELTVQTGSDYASTARLLHLESRSVGGRTYEVYYESAEDIGNRLDDFNSYIFETRTRGVYISIKFSEGLGLAQTNASFGNAVEFAKGLYKAFVAGLWERAKVLREGAMPEPTVLFDGALELSQATTAYGVDITNWKQYNYIVIVYGPNSYFIKTSQIDLSRNGRVYLGGNPFVNAANSYLWISISGSDHTTADRINIARGTVVARTTITFIGGWK